ncbi:MAG: zinc-ribbon domain-containing protein, partial [Turicibacter sp.]|nr:zinc-ribbon domain-containing protein [Turicibacter sp.]
EMPDTSSFCQTCGNKLKDERETIVSTICPECGMENGANANTCIKCGKLL